MSGGGLSKLSAHSIGFVSSKTSEKRSILKNKNSSSNAVTQKMVTVQSKTRILSADTSVKNSMEKEENP
jgi:hypothetical protein